MRLNVYRGLVSSVYIFLFSNDFILIVFELVRELRCVVKVEKYYKVRYKIYWIYKVIKIFICWYNVLVYFFGKIEWNDVKKLYVFMLMV